MTRLVLMFVISAILPTGIYVLWRAFAPTKLGGSRAIAREEWEPLPWPWLILAGVFLMIVMFFMMGAYPEILDF